MDVPRATTFIRSLVSQVSWSARCQKIQSLILFCLAIPISCCQRQFDSRQYNPTGSQGRLQNNQLAGEGDHKKLKTVIMTDTMTTLPTPPIQTSVNT